MQITKKDKTNFDAINYCIKARAKEVGWPGLQCIYIEKNRAITTDGHRLHIAWTKNIPDGLYEYSKVKQVITLTPSEHRFPDYKAIVPKTFSHQVTANTKELLQMAKMAKIIITDPYQGACLTFNGCLNIKVVSPDLGDMTGDVNISKAVDPELKIGINLKYVIDALKGLDKQVAIGLQDDKKALIFRDKNKCALIMPMRV